VLELKICNLNTGNYYVNLKIDNSILKKIIWIQKLLIESNNWYINSDNFEWNSKIVVWIRNFLFEFFENVFRFEIFHLILKLDISILKIII
jgi:hypothetical protein